MPKRTREEAERTRESLIAAARKGFAERGYDDVSLADVASSARVTRGALYHHFGGKLGLFRAVCTRLLEETGASILQRAAQESDPYRSLLEGSRRFLRLSQHREYRRIVLIDAPAVLGIEEWQALDDEYTTATLREALSDLTHSGQLTIPDTAAMAQALSGAMNQLALWEGSAAGDQPTAAERSYRTVEHLVAALRNQVVSTGLESC